MNHNIDDKIIETAIRNIYPKKIVVSYNYYEEDVTDDSSYLKFDDIEEFYNYLENGESYILLKYLNIENNIIVGDMCNQTWTILYDYSNEEDHKKSLELCNQLKQLILEKNQSN